MLIKTFFQGNEDVVRFEAGLSGQSVTEDGVILLGDRAGPELDETNTIHEIAHMLDIDRERMAVHGWGLRYGTWWEIASWCGWEPQTNQHVKREAHVWGMQTVLQRGLGIKTEIEELVSSAIYLPLPWCGLEGDKLVEVVSEHADSYTFGKLMDEWRSRIEWLRDQRIN